MQNLEKLATLAAALPREYATKASDLVRRMGEVIEGLSDKPMEFRPPTIKLVQATTDRSKLPKGATIGSLILGENVVTPPLKVIPIRMFTTRQMWDADPDKSAMICSSPDGDTGFRYGNCKACPHQKFDEVAKKSACNKTMTVLSVTEDLSSIFFTNFSKTNYSSGLDWQGLMKKAGVAPYKRIYEMSSGTSPKVKNVEIIKIEPIATGNTVDAKILPFIEELFAVASEDRKESLKQFYEYIETKRDASALALGHTDTAPEAEGSVTLIAAEPTSAATTSTAGGYTL